MIYKYTTRLIHIQRKRNFPFSNWKFARSKSGYILFPGISDYVNGYQQSDNPIEDGGKGVEITKTMQ